LLGAIATASALGNLAYTQMQPAEQFLSANTHTVLGFLPVALLALITFQQLSDRTGALLRSGSYASFILIFFACTVLRDVLKVAGVAELHPFSALPYLVLLVASTRVSRANGASRRGLVAVQMSTKQGEAGTRSPGIDERLRPAPHHAEAQHSSNVPPTCPVCRTPNP
jgi:hypothetical protein